LRWLASEPPNVENAVLSANRMIRDANRTSEVIQRVRKLVKNTPPQMSPLNVNEAIEEIVILCRNEIEQNRISLKTQLPPDLPLVYADRVQLQQVFINLIVNAIDALKAVSAGPREVSVTTEKDKASGVLATVRDSGGPRGRRRSVDLARARGADVRIDSGISASQTARRAQDASCSTSGCQGRADSSSSAQ
jgi:signal transduction histidine kinase